MEAVEVCPPFDISDITALVAARAMVDVLASMTKHGRIGETALSTAARAHISEGSPAFILATDRHPRDPAWSGAEMQARAVSKACETILGFQPIVNLGAIDSLPAAHEISILPTAPDFNLFQREALRNAIGAARRSHPRIALHHDDLDPAHPLLIECLAEQVAWAIAPDPRSGFRWWRDLRQSWKEYPETQLG
jgi:hypothetical protein